MTQKQKERLIEALEIRKKQFFDKDKNKYPLNDGHHIRDVVTTLAVLKDDRDADALLAQMPTSEDLPCE